MVRGRIAFLPWVSIEKRVSLLGFVFQPMKLDEIAAFIAPEIVAAAAAAIQTHVNQAGKPVDRCTLVLRPGSRVPWDIPNKSWRRLAWATELLAFGALAEQRFLVDPVFAPHMNAAMFKPVNHAVTAGSPFFSVFYPRRGGGLRVGGRRAARVAKDTGRGASLQGATAGIRESDGRRGNVPLASFFAGSSSSRTLPAWSGYPFGGALSSGFMMRCRYSDRHHFVVCAWSVM